jgi:hypothetical protein
MAADPSLQNIGVIGLDPGAMPTELGRRADALTRFKIYYVLPYLAPLSAFFKRNGPLRPAAQSAADIIRAAFETETPHGRVLYLDGSEESQMSEKACNVSNNGKLWKYGVQASKLEPGDTVLAWQ